jgi:hypothetical protein
MPVMAADGKEHVRVLESVWHMISENSEHNEESANNREQATASAARLNHQAEGTAVGRGRAPCSVELPRVEPWLEAVNGAELLDGLRTELQRFVVFSKWAAETIALWILHTYAFRLRDVTTYIGIESPEKECGKSTLLTVLSHFVDRAAVSSNISSSAFFRAIDELEPTLLIDEADTNLRGKDDLTGILNSGYTKQTAFVWRICYDTMPEEAEQSRKSEIRSSKSEINSNSLRTEEGERPAQFASNFGRCSVEGASSPQPSPPEEEREKNRASSAASSPKARGNGGGNPAGRVAQYSSWCPKAIAAIGHLHPTLASRCVVIRMQRKTAVEGCERLKWLDGTELKRKCARFVADHAAEIAKAEPKIPEGLANRAADVWEPLLALADLAGGRWPELAREAATGLTARAQEYSPIGSLLLDILLAFVLRKEGRIFSRDLVTEMLACGDRPWIELRKGKPVTESWLAQQLRPYGIKPRTIRIGDKTSKGYVEEEFTDTFRRYIPKSEVDELKADLAARAVPGPGPGPGAKASAPAAGEIT